MTVVAEYKDREAALRWVDYLLTNEIFVEYVDPEFFSANTDVEYMAIMGGVDNAEIKKILTDLIGAGEVAAMSKKGAKKMYLIEDKYSMGQKILVYTGSDSEASANARTESRDEWMPMLEEWFGLDEGPVGLKAY
jgi:hypothetical protein